MPDKKLNEVFADIADAIREKTGSEGKITPLEMASNIHDLDTVPDDLESSHGYIYQGGNDFYQFSSVFDGMALQFLQTDCYYYIGSNGSMVAQDGSYIMLNGHAIAGTEDTDDGLYYFKQYSQNDQYLGNNGIFYVDNDGPTELSFDENEVYRYNGDDDFEHIYLSSSSIYDSSLSPIHEVVSDHAYVYHGFANFTDISDDIPDSAGIWYCTGSHYANCFEVSLTAGNTYTYVGDSRFTELNFEDNHLYWNNGYYIKDVTDDVPATEGLYYCLASEYTFLDVELQSGTAYVYEGMYDFTPISGTLNVTDNGTYNVTNYASVNVQVAGQSLSDGIWYIGNDVDKPLQLEFDSNYIYWYQGGSYFGSISIGQGVYSWAGNELIDVTYQIPFSDGLYYKLSSTPTDWSGQIELSTGGIYTYVGGSEFEPYEPDETHVDLANGYYYVNSNEPQFLADDGVVTIGGGYQPIQICSSNEMDELVVGGEISFTYPLYDGTERHYKLVRID